MEYGTEHSICAVPELWCVAVFLYQRLFILAQAHEEGGIDLGRFYLSRFIRLAPLYYVCIGIALCIGFFLSSFSLLVPVRELGASLIPWMLFSLGGEPFVNGADIKRIVSGVVWKLANEWVFYLSLPFLAWFARKSKRLVHLACMLLLIFALSKVLSSGRIHQEWIVGFFLIIRELAKFMLIGFGGGILVAVFQEKVAKRVTISSSARNWLLLAIYLLFLFAPLFRSFMIVGVPLLLIGFTLVVLGTDLFGFITSMPVRFLGIIRASIPSRSKAIYRRQRCALSIVLTSALFHFLDERPSMKLTEKIARNPSVDRLPGLLKHEAERVAAG